MHALKQDTQEVVQGHDKGVGPLAPKVGGKGGAGVWRWQEGQDKPILPPQPALSPRPALQRTP